MREALPDAASPTGSGRGERVASHHLRTIPRYRLPGGLAWKELETTIRVAAASGEALGIEITIFNPTLDPGGAIAEALVACLVRALEPSR